MQQAMLRGQAAGFRPVTSTKSGQQNRTRSFVCRAALDAGAITAVTQQTIAFAAVVGAEAAYTGLSTKADQPGRPQVLPTLVGALGTVAATVLLQQGDGVGTTGCIVGSVVSGFMLVTYALRVRDTPYDPLDWPGAKAWPAVMGLISFFALSAFAQGALDSVGKLG